MSVTAVRYGQVNHERVRRAMAEVGARLEAERLQRVAVEHAEIARRRGRICGGTDWRTGQPCEWEAEVSWRGLYRCWWHVEDLVVEPTPPRHDYGPHRDEDAPKSVVVLPPGKWPQEVIAAIHPATMRANQRINDLAHAASQARRSA